MAHSSVPVSIAAKGMGSAQSQQRRLRGSKASKATRSHQAVRRTSFPTGNGARREHATSTTTR
eukprot:489423-Pleurochrysis_carterae.AAC.1